MGKDTQIRPIRLDNREMLLECAEDAGLDVNESRRVLDSNVYRQDILGMVQSFKDAGVRSIPVVIFEVDGVARGDWLSSQSHRGRVRLLLLLHRRPGET